MMFLNEGDVVCLYRRYQDRPHPVLTPATVVLQALMDLVNANSDGWPYWQVPQRASLKLRELVAPNGSTHGRGNEDATPEQLKKALVPIKTFLTKHEHKFKHARRHIDTIRNGGVPNRIKVCYDNHDEGIYANYAAAELEILEQHAAGAAVEAAHEINADDEPIKELSCEWSVRLVVAAEVPAGTR